MITVSIQTQTPVKKVWEYWTQPEYITQWNFASEDWSCPMAINPLNEGSEFNWRMEAKDGSFGFDFKGVYTSIIPLERIEYKMEDGRKVEISFKESNGITTVTEAFEPEGSNADEMQRNGWQAILNRFKSLVEA